ncbi:MAG: hypothetical protein ACT4OY_04545 [Alphaproteobacteria bacterium]
MARYFLVFTFILIAGVAHAQGTPVEPAAEVPAIIDPAPAAVEPVVAPADTVEKPPVVAPVADGTTPDGAQKSNRIPLRSLLFTVGEYTALQQAKSYRGMVRPPTESEMNNVLLPPSEKIKPPPEKREIKLGGLVYRSPKNWTIWLNGERVSPDALPKEALDLKVMKNYIEIKWFDDYTNQIFPLRLRPHQRFNIDTRIFLPG